MTFTLSKTDNLSKIICVDLVLLATICFVPALSHLFAVPFYKANPMLLCMVAGMILVRDRRNAYLLAVMLPLVSMMTTGMPDAMKAACMIPELLTVVAVSQLLERHMPTFVSMVAAILAGKVVFYGLKALLIAPAILVGTNLWLQLGTMVFYAAAFAFFTRRRK